MRIVFDGSTLTPGRTGVGYYTEHLLQHLAREVAVSGDELVVISNQPIQTESTLPAHVRVHAGHRFPIRLGWLQLQAARAIDAIKPDVAHFTNGMVPFNAGVSTVVTVHDMSLHLYPRCHPVRRLLLNRPLLRTAVHRAAAIVTVSHSTRRDLLSLHDVPPDRVTVVHEAASPAFRPLRDQAARAAMRARLRLPDRFALYVGAVEPRKNLTRLMTAFASARAAGIPHHLVCVGPYGWLSADLEGHIDRLGLRPYVHFTGYLPFDWLPAVYNLSEFVAFPSLYEGFGLPVIEAMACGTPVVTSNTSSLAEIAGEAALTVDPLDTGALSDAVRRLATDCDLRAHLSMAGLARSQAFSWTQSARQMLSVYRQAVGRTASRREPANVAHPVPAAEIAEAAGGGSQRHSGGGQDVG